MFLSCFCFSFVYRSNILISETIGRHKPGTVKKIEYTVHAFETTVSAKYLRHILASAGHSVKCVIDLIFFFFLSYTYHSILV